MQMLMCSLYHLAKTSCTVTVSAWPKCRDPVTFGGGRIMENVFSAEGLDSALKCPFSFQCAYHPRSTWPLSYTDGYSSNGVGGRNVEALTMKAI